MKPTAVMQMKGAVDLGFTDISGLQSGEIQMGDRLPMENEGVQGGSRFMIWTFG